MINQFPQNFGNVVYPTNAQVGYASPGNMTVVGQQVAANQGYVTPNAINYGQFGYGIAGYNQQIIPQQYAGSVVMAAQPGIVAQNYGYQQYVVPGYGLQVQQIPNKVIAGNGFVQGQVAYAQSPTGVNLDRQVYEQAVAVPQAPQSQIVQEVHRVPLQIQGPPNRHVVRQFNQRVVSIPQPPEVRIVNETVRQPVMVQPPPQVQTIMEKHQRTVMVPTPPEIRMQRTQVMEGPFVQNPSGINITPTNQGLILDGSQATMIRQGIH